MDRLILYKYSLLIITGGFLLIVLCRSLLAGCSPANTPETTDNFSSGTMSIAKQLPEGMVKPIVGHSRAMDTFGVYGNELNGEQDHTKQ